MIDESFKNYFKFPLFIREEMPYVFGHDGKPVLTWLDGIPLEIQQKIINKVNGYSKENFEEKWEIRDNIFIYYNGKKVMFVRGWGMLTGTCAYNLKEDIAKRLQDNFAKYILEKL